MHGNGFLAGFPRKPVEPKSELIGYKAGEHPAENPGVCSQEVQPLMPPALEVSGERIVLTCVMAPLDIDLRREAPTTATSLAGDVIVWEIVSRPGMTTTSSTGATSVIVPRGPVKLVGELAVCTAGKLVAMYLDVCNHEFPLVTSPVIQALRSPVMRATRWRIVLI